MATYIAQENNTRREMTDAEVIATFAPQVALTANKLTVNADSVDFVTVSIQLKSLPLSDDKQVNLALAHPVILMIGELELRLDTDANGHASQELDFDTAGVYVIGVQYLNGNSLTITAV